MKTLETLLVSATR